MATVLQSVCSTSSEKNLLRISAVGNTKWNRITLGQHGAMATVLQSVCSTSSEKNLLSLQLGIQSGTGIE